MEKYINISEEMGKNILSGSRDGIKIAYEKILPLTDKLSAGEGLCIDLNGIELVDDSFANQAFVAPMITIREEGSQKYLYFKLSNSLVKKVLERVLLRNELITVICEENRKNVIGSTGISLIDIFSKINTLGEIYEENLSTLTGVEYNQCQNRIKKLIDFGIVQTQQKEGKVIYKLVNV